jgi:IS30 family transposase
MARRLGRSASTISREVARNRGRERYQATAAQVRADRARRRPKVPKLVADRGLRERVEGLLKAGFSPAATTALLRCDGGPYVVAETIYQALYSPTYRGIRLRPQDCLRTRRHRRNPYRRRQARAVRLLAMSSVKLIDQRPDISGREEPGHWEGDLIVGANNGSGVVTLIERSTRYAILSRLRDRRSAHEVAAALIAAFEQVPVDLRRTLTWDQGRELIWNWMPIEETLGLSIYFCHPHSPWERPTNENLNRQIRFWLPKRTDLGVHDQSDLDAVTNVLNNQPRRIFGWETPAQRYARHTVH